MARTKQTSRKNESPRRPDRARFNRRSPSPPPADDTGITCRTCGKSYETVGSLRRHYYDLHMKAEIGSALSEERRFDMMENRERGRKGKHTVVKARYPIDKSNNFKCKTESNGAEGTTLSDSGDGEDKSDSERKDQKRNSAKGKSSRDKKRKRSPEIVSLDVPLPKGNNRRATHVTETITRHFFESDKLVETVTTHRTYDIPFRPDGCEVDDFSERECEKKSNFSPGGRSDETDDNESEEVDGDDW